MGEEKKNGKEKKKKGKLLKWLILLFFFGGSGGGVGYYLKPDLFKKYFNKAKEQVQKVTKKIKEKTSKVTTTKSALTIKGHKVEAEIANTPIKREVGYMNRKSIPENTGMLFVYKSEREVSFWMKNTLVPLSIAFIKTDGTIAKITDMEVAKPGTADADLKSYLSGDSVKYALEVNKGWFAKKGIRAGDKVEGLDKLPQEEVE